MKKFICVAFALMSCISIANGQWQGKMNNRFFERNKDHHSDPPLQIDHFKNDVLPVTDTKSDFYDPKTLMWNFDTVITYDTEGLLQRLIQTFDIHGSV